MMSSVAAVIPRSMAFSFIVRIPCRRLFLRSYSTPWHCSRPLGSSTRGITTSIRATSIPSPSFPASLSVPDTIYSLSSGTLQTVSGVAVIRLSGSSSHWALSTLLKPESSLPAERRAVVRDLVDPRNRLLLDNALVLLFNGPRSFTGEDVVELHVHGSRAVVRGVLDALSSLDCVSHRVRPSTRGEFTRRAFENGKMDLTAVEGLADLLAANTQLQRIQALKVAGGNTATVISDWRSQALQCMAHAEAVLDFSDDVDDDTFDKLVPRVRKLSEDISSRLVRDGRVGELIREGVKVAIVGPPNVGKSTMLNALAQRPVAIVTDIPGTTRDVLSVDFDLKGIPVTLFDTAGIRQVPDDKVEEEGIRRARQTFADAQVAVMVVDARRPDFEISAELSRLEKVDGKHVIQVANKTDLLDDNSRRQLPHNMLQLSLLRGNEGLDNLVNVLTRIVSQYVGSSDDEESPLVTRARHRYHLQRAVFALEKFVSMRNVPEKVQLPMDVAAEELRLACREIGAVLGTIEVEEVLDVVFQEFCIGK